jgi:predicted PurR-regulated permease PerM
VANEAGDRSVRRTAVLGAGLTPGAAVLLVAAVVTGFALAGAFELAHRTFGWVVACSIVALLVDPLVDFVARVVPRWLAVIIVLLMVLGVIAALVVGVANDLLNSIDDLKESAPLAAESLERQHTWARDLELAERVRSFVGELDERVRSGTVSRALGTAPSYVVTGILMLFLLAYGRRYFDGFAAQFSAERGDRIRTVGYEAATRGRRYILVVLGQSIFNGLVVGLVCWSVGLPAAVSLGFVVGVLTALPLVGVMVGGIPALLLAFGLLAWWEATIVLLVLLALQIIEVTLVRPYIDTRTVRIGPTIPIIVGLLGFELYGVGGAVYGIALAVIGLAALDAAGRQLERPAPA